MATIPSPRTWQDGEEVLEAYLDKDLRDGWRFFTNPPRVKVYNSIGQTVNAAVGTSTQDIVLLWDTEVYDSDGMFNRARLGGSSDSRITINTAGCYQVVLHINWSIDNQVSDSTHGPGNKYAAVKLNASATASLGGTQTTQWGTDISHILPSDSVGPQTSHISFQMFLAQGDYLEAMTGTSSFANTQTISGGAIRTIFAARWLSVS